MNKFERLKEMTPQEAQDFIAKIVGDGLAKKFFVEDLKMIKAGKARVGSTVKYAGIEWVVLSRTAGKVMVLAKQDLGDRVFDTDERNNWANSSLRKELNNFNKRGFQCGFKHLKNVNKKDLVEFERDLTTDDGITDYGKCKDYISLISCEEYRKFRKFIPNADDWWWTLTGDSLVYSCNVRSVYSNGALSGSHAYYGPDGVRPLCVLKSDTNVETGNDLENAIAYWQNLLIEEA